MRIIRIPARDGDSAITLRIDDIRLTLQYNVIDDAWYSSVDDVMSGRPMRLGVDLLRQLADVPDVLIPARVSGVGDAIGYQDVINGEVVLLWWPSVAEMAKEVGKTLP